MESVYEEIFLLKYHGNWGFREAYSLPIKLREWFVGRLLKQKQTEHDAASDLTSGLSQKHTLGESPAPAPPININK
tara:strand:- start:89 stop:316 length:228 start_codon:yes stop_codon:yes gene_type:complete